MVNDYKDYNTQRAVDNGDKAYVISSAFKAGQRQGSSTAGFISQGGANLLITSLSDILADAPQDWADRIVVSVG